jgi:hypothetical protein
MAQSVQRIAYGMNVSVFELGAKKRTYLENMQTEFEANRATCSADTWQGCQGSG